MKEFDLQKALDAISARAEETREQEDQFQTEMRETVASTIDPNSARERIARARQQETALLEQILVLSEAEDSDLKQSRLFTFLNRLSEVLFEQGKYQEAIEVCPETDRREFYEKVLAAIERPDSETCECEAERIIDARTRQQIDVSSETAVLEVIMPDGTAKLLYQCRCGFMNVR